MPNTGERNLMTLLVSPSERDLLDAICDQDGGASRSAVVRKLISQEAQRRGLPPVALPTANTVAQAG